MQCVCIGMGAGDAQPEGVHSMVSTIDIQLVLQHMFPNKSEADITAAIRAVSSDSHVTIAALMPMQRCDSCMCCSLPSGQHLCTSVDSSNVCRKKCRNIRTKYFQQVRREWWHDGCDIPYASALLTKLPDQATYSITKQLVFFVTGDLVFGNTTAHQQINLPRYCSISTLLMLTDGLAACSNTSPLICP